MTVEYSPGSRANRSQSSTHKEKSLRCVACVILFSSHSLTPPSQLATRSTFKHPSHRGPHFHLELKCGEIDQDVISIDRALRAKAIATATAVTVQHKPPPPVPHTAVVITPKVAAPARKRRRRGASPRRPEAIDIDAWTSADIVQRRKWVKQEYNRNYMARKKEQRRLAAAQEMIKEEVKEEILEPVATSRDEGHDDDNDHDDHVMDTQDADTTYSHTDVLYDEVSGDDSTDVQETEDEEYAEVRAPIDSRFRWWY